MAKIRVLVVDDSAVIRRLVSDALAADPAIEIAGTAPNGHIALEKIPQLNPDIITLDVEMPEMNGLETIRAIRKSWPGLPVIMFSSLTERDASTTLDALAAGATDYVAKPNNTGSLDASVARVRDDLIPKIKGLAAPRATRIPPRLPSATAPHSVRRRIDIVAIGASTGGPNALAEVIPSFPENFPVPIVIVQHMPPLFTRMLARRLDANSPLGIREGEPGQALQPGQAWLAPGDYHMTLAHESRGARIELNQDAPENSCRPAVDVLFRSVAAVYGPNVLGVVLTGMGSDGLRGSQAIREAGGQIFVQDEASSVVWGMPGAIVAAGQADRVYALDQIGPEVVRQIELNHPAGPAGLLAPGKISSNVAPAREARPGETSKRMR